MNEDNKINFFDEPNLNDILGKEENKPKDDNIFEKIDKAISLNDRKKASELKFSLRNKICSNIEKKVDALLKLEDFIPAKNKGRGCKMNYDNLTEQIKELSENKEFKKLNYIKKNLQKKNTRYYPAIETEERKKLITLINNNLENIENKKVKLSLKSLKEEKIIKEI